MQAAPRDALTGALLRNTFEDDVADWLARGAQQGIAVSLLVVDLDYLKLINDAFGHLAGDSALASVAACLREHMKADDLLFRYGGDEFVVLLPKMNLEQASQRARAMLNTVSTSPLEVVLTPEPIRDEPIRDEPMRAGRVATSRQKVSLSLSIGVASLAPHESERSVQALFAQADARAYLSKKRGRGCVTDDDVNTDESGSSSAGRFGSLHPNSPQPNNLAETRLLGREDSLERVRNFLRLPSTPVTANPVTANPATANPTTVNPPAKRALCLYGQAGSGMSRVLDYAATLATMLGDVVIQLEASPARQLRWLAALSEAKLSEPWLSWQTLCQPERVLRLLEQHPNSTKVIVIVDRVDLLDRASHSYVLALLAALPTVSLLYSTSSNHTHKDSREDSQQALHNSVDVVAQIHLRPLSYEDLARWLQGSLKQHMHMPGNHMPGNHMPGSHLGGRVAARTGVAVRPPGTPASSTHAPQEPDDALTKTGLALSKAPAQQPVQQPTQEPFSRMIYELTQGLPAQVARVISALDAGLVNRTASLEQQRSRLQTLLTDHVSDSLLPLSRGMFVGRYETLATVKRWLHPGALVTVVGADGMGKSRLALQAAKESAGRFLGGVYWLSLAPLAPPEHLIYTIAEAMNVSFGNVQGPQAPVFNALRQAPSLLILDNLNHAPRVLETIYSIQQYAPQTSLLITSPEALKLTGERSLHLTGLPPLQTHEDANLNSSFVLFTTYARQAAPTYSFDGNDPSLRAAVQVIHEAVAGMPLGLELAAAWCGVYSPQAIAELLQQDKLVLDADLPTPDISPSNDEPTGIVVADVVADVAADVAADAALATSLPIRSTASASTSLATSRVSPTHAEHGLRQLRGVLEAFWQLLSEYEQQALASLTVFPGHFAETMARQVAGASPFFLASLWHKSFLTHGNQLGQQRQQQESRYEMPLLLRQFVASKLADQPVWQRQAERALVHSMMNWLAELEVTMWDERQAATFQMIHSNIETINKAWQLLASFDSPESTGSEAASLDPEGKVTALLRNYYEIFAGQTRRGAALFTDLVEAFAAEQPRFASFQAYAATRLWSRAGDLERSKQAAAQTLALLEQSPDPDNQGFAEIAWIHHLSAENQMLSGHYAHVLASLEAAVTYFDQLGHRRGWVAAMIGHGKWYILQADYTRAHHYVKTAFDQAQHINLRVGTCLSLHYVGAVALATQAWDDASQHLHDCIDMAQAIGFERAEALSHLSLARCVTRRAGIGFATGFKASGRRSTSIVAHQLARARWHLDQALQCWERKGLTVELIYTLHELASLAYEAGNDLEAGGYLSRALVIAKDTAFVPSLLSCLAVVACYTPDLLMVERVVQVIDHHPAASPRLRKLVIHQFGHEMSKQHARPTSAHALTMLCDEILEYLHEPQLLV
ncbi:MAG: diguanylate cyclase [Deinococcota bacterium]